jgi:hypothetical protein
MITSLWAGRHCVQAFGEHGLTPNVLCLAHNHAVPAHISVYSLAAGAGDRHHRLVTHTELRNVTLLAYYAAW